MILFRRGKHTRCNFYTGSFSQGAEWKICNHKEHEEKRQETNKKKKEKQEKERRKKRLFSFAPSKGGNKDCLKSGTVGLQHNSATIARRQETDLGPRRKEKDHMPMALQVANKANRVVQCGRQESISGINCPLHQGTMPINHTISGSAASLIQQDCSMDKTGFFPFVLPMLYLHVIAFCIGP